MREFETLTWKVADRIGTITFNRPEQRNPFSQAFKDDLSALLREIQFSDDLGAIIMTGAGGAFSAGGDIKGMNAGPRRTDRDRKRMYELHDWFQILLNLEIPVIAAVDGAAYGGGFGLALAADFVLASERARFCCVFARIGLVPDVGCLFTLPRIVGMQKAKELAFTARAIDAAEAKSLGIAMEVHPVDELMPAARALAQRLVAASTPAIGATKRILTQSFNLDAHALIEMEAASQAIMFQTEYHKDAIRRFVGKEPLAFNWEAMDKAEKG